MAVPLDAHVVIDNSVLVMLTDFACDCQPVRLTGMACIEAMLKCIAEHLDVVRQLTPDTVLHCTDRVAGEYRPEKGPVGKRYGVKGVHLKELREGVCSLLVETSVDRRDIDFLGGLPGIPSNLRGRYGPSDNDLSLLALGLNLASQGPSVNILTNDDDLERFVHAACQRNQHTRLRWQNSKLVDAFHGITYLQSAHEACRISNDQLWGLLKFVMNGHVKRMVDSIEVARGSSHGLILGPRKSMDIYGKLERAADLYQLAAQRKAVSVALRGTP